MTYRCALQGLVGALVCAAAVSGQGIKFPAVNAVDDFDYGRSCPNEEPDYCGCTGDQTLMEQTWRPATELGLIGWTYDPDLGTLTSSPIGGGNLVSSFSSCATNGGFRGASPPLSLQVPSSGLRMNYLDLGAMASAIDPTKNAVNGTDENPLFVRVSFTPPNTSNQQFYTSCYVQLFSGTDVAPVVTLDEQNNPTMLRICRDNTAGYSPDAPSSAIAFGYRGGRYGGLHLKSPACGDDNWAMYRHVLYDGRRWVMLKGNVPVIGAPNVPTSTRTTTAILKVMTTTFDVKVFDHTNTLVAEVLAIPRNSTAQGPFQYLAVGTSATSERQIFIDDVAIAGDEALTTPGGVLGYYVDPTGGACCKADKTCEVLNEADCEAIADAEFKGGGTVCGQGPGRCCADPMVDGDEDGDVDMDDFARFQRCLTTGTLTPTIGEGCSCFDTDDDGDIDDVDFGNFAGTSEVVGCVSGPGIPADVTCDDEF